MPLVLLDSMIKICLVLFRKHVSIFFLGIFVTIQSRKGAVEGLFQTAQWEFPYGMRAFVHQNR